MSYVQQAPPAYTRYGLHYSHTALLCSMLLIVHSFPFFVIWQTKIKTNNNNNIIFYDRCYFRQSWSHRRRSHPVGDCQSQGLSVGQRKPKGCPKRQLCSRYGHQPHATRRRKVDDYHWPGAGPGSDFGKENNRLHPPTEPGSHIWNQGWGSRWRLRPGGPDGRVQSAPDGRHPRDHRRK